MKMVLSVLAISLSLSSLAVGEAAAEERRYRLAEGQKLLRFYGRPQSVQANGLCQRDTGTPTSELNFRNKCDVEEFWNRTFSGGRRR